MNKLVIKSALLVTLGSFSLLKGFCQSTSLKEIQRDLNQSYLKILDYNNNPTDSIDSLEYYNDLFDKKMSYYTTHYPATLSFPFDSLRLNDNISIATSDDSLFRIYSWDRHDGGTMHYFDNIFQFKSGDKTCSKLFVDTSADGSAGAGAFYSHIYTLTPGGISTPGNKTYYIAIGNDILGQGLSDQFVKIFTIENNSLYDSVKLFKTKTGLQNSIWVEYNFMSVINHPERPVKLIKTSSSDDFVGVDQIYIPVVDKSGNVTDTYIVYSFDGKYFVFRRFMDMDKINKENTQAIATDRKYGKQYLGGGFIHDDSTIIILGSGGQNLEDYRIFGFEKPDIHSKKLILLSIFTKDVEGNLFNFPMGAYYSLDDYPNVSQRGIWLKYLSTNGKFIKVAVYKSIKRIGTAYMLKKWFEFNDNF